MTAFEHLKHHLKPLMLIPRQTKVVPDNIYAGRNPTCYGSGCC